MSESIGYPPYWKGADESGFAGSRARYFGALMSRGLIARTAFVGGYQPGGMKTGVVSTLQDRVRAQRKPQTSAATTSKPNDTRAVSIAGV